MSRPPRPLAAAALLVLAGRGSPASTRATPTGPPGADSDLYVMNADGSAVTRLTHADSEEQEPALTPCKGVCP